MTDFWKGKKIFAYIALAHHTRFITPVMAALKKKGARIKYIVGQAERSQEVTAIQLGLSYTHIFDCITASDKEEIQKNYQHLKKTFSKALKTDFLIGVSPVTVMDKTLLATAVEYTGFKNLFKTGKPDICFALHELNRWGKMFAFWAKKNNVPFMTMQEGLTYGLDFGYSGHAQYSTLNLVWGKRIRDKLVHFDAPESKTFPIGNTHLAEEMAYQKKQEIGKKIRRKYKVENTFVTLLILSAQLPVPILLAPIFKAVSTHKDQRLFIKFHPSCKLPHMETWTGKIEKKDRQNCFFIHLEESTYDLISAANVVVLGQMSTTGLESLSFGKPIVKLDFAYIPDAPYSFVDNGVAVKMRPDQLASALLKKADFSTYCDPETVERYLENELADTTNAIQAMCRVFKKAIQANADRIKQLPRPGSKALLDWSIVLSASNDPDIFLAQLEAIAVNSQDAGEFETFILVPPKVSDKITHILDSLEGGVHIVRCHPGQSTTDIINQAITPAAGRYFIFIEKNLAPLKNWLHHLKKAIKKNATPGEQIFGGRIADPNGRIAHAGMVVDHNNSPVSAYQHLNLDHEGAAKERNFQMLDFFIALKRDSFFKIGGFTPDAGRFRFMDICMKCIEMTDNPESIIYLPQVQLIFLNQIPALEKMEDAAYFYSRWHNQLWESENHLYNEDGISLQKLNQAKISAAMSASG